MDARFEARGQARAPMHAEHHRSLFLPEAWGAKAVHELGIAGDVKALPDFGRPEVPELFDVVFASRSVDIVYDNQQVGLAELYAPALREPAIVAPGLEHVAVSA